MKRRRYGWLWLLLFPPSLALAAPPTGEDRMLTMQSSERRIIGCKEAPETLASWTKVCVLGSNDLKPCSDDGDCSGGSCKRALVRVIGQQVDADPYAILPNDCFTADNNTRLRCMVVPYARNGRKYQIRMYAITTGQQLLACDIRVDVSDVGPFKPQ